MYEFIGGGFAAKILTTGLHVRLSAIVLVFRTFQNGNGPTV
jgi:hypothetical protein